MRVIVACFVPTAPRYVRRKQKGRVAEEVEMTRRTSIKIIVVAAVILGFGGLVAYQFTGGNEYSSNIADVKNDFNRDKGKVRLVVLLSPT